MSKNPPEGYVFDEQYPWEFSICGNRPASFNLRGWKCEWPDLTDPPIKKPDFIKRSGWVELGPIVFWYTCGRRALNEEKIKG